MLVPAENDRFLENAIRGALLLPRLVGHTALHPVSRRAVGVLLQEAGVERRQSLVRVEALLGSDRSDFVALDHQGVLGVRRLLKLELLFVHQEDLAVELLHRVLLHGLHRQSLLGPGGEKAPSGVPGRFFFLMVGD